MRLRLISFTLSLLFAFAMASTAMADTLQLAISVNGTVCHDGDACDSNPNAGAVTFVSTSGTITVDSGFGQPNQATNNLDLLYSMVDAPVGTYTIEVSETDLNIKGLPFVGAFGGTQSAGDTATYNSFYGNGDNLFGMGSALCSIGPDGDAPSYSGTCTGGPINNGSNPYSLTEQVVLNIGKAGDTSTGDASLTAVPEASGLSMLGFTALVMVGALKRKFIS